MRIYAASRGDVVKGALYMIGFVAVMDVAMVLFLVHVLHRSVSFTAQWPIGLLLVGVIAFAARSFNLASRSWVQVTPKQLTWAAGPKPAKLGLTPSGSVKLADVSAVSVQLDEVQARVGRKDVTLRLHRLHAEIEGKPVVVLPVAALESADKAAPESLERGRDLLLRAVVQINANAKGFVVDTSVMGDVVLPAEGASAGEGGSETASAGTAAAGEAGEVSASAESAELAEESTESAESTEIKAEAEGEGETETEGESGSESEAEAEAEAEADATEFESVEAEALDAESAELEAADVAAADGAAAAKA